VVLNPAALFAQDTFAARVRELADRRNRELRILEAGCGRRWTLDIHDVKYHLTGVEIDPRALRARIKGGDLDEWILGDLRTVELPGPPFDVVFCSYVLEHVENAEQVLKRITDALAPGGLLLLRIPDRDSVFGFITRVTPYRFHVFYKRRIGRDPQAGQPGHDPYPTVYDKVVSIRGVHEFCQQHGLRIVDELHSPVQLMPLGRYAGLVRAGLRAIEAVSFRRLAADHGPVAFVIEKPER
jgi:SAM-dependent methyltransferase